MAYTEKKRKDVVTKYVIYGNIRRVSDECEVPVETIYDWMKEDWWKSLENEIRGGIKTELRAKMQGIVDKALDILNDRLENGEVVLNMKTGETVRRPVPARDVQRIATEVLGKKLVLEKEVDRSQVQKETVTEMLGALAKGFLEFNNKLKQKEVVVLDNVSDIAYKEVN